ncbi:SDR family NAD(P)-dependent oxidoreductase [Croceicoccus sediminis]|uniref:SDR family NAD(P)-dependent oxidoreductase n=1 Tax=Croceicoccus sediminis TaxID=2571150 RepID=UPI0011830341|nr:SDR family oxidoreductase [Croceicoccus sediminis]
MTPDFDFTGKTALITGAASGIGAAVASWLDAHGAAKLVLVDMDRPALDAMVFGCEAVRIGGDVSDAALWTIGMRDLGTVDCALLNAGIAPGGKSIVDSDIAEWKKCMAVNVDGVFLGLRRVMKAMADNGGSIVVTSSVSGTKPYPGTAAYATSKAAVLQLMRVAAAEGASQGIRVNAIAPGPVDTAIWDKADITGSLHGDQDARAAMMGELAKGTLLKRVPETDEIAASIGFLLSDLAANITGTALLSDGGASLRV